jgi:hypothetical protein
MAGSARLTLYQVLIFSGHVGTSAFGPLMAPGGDLEGRDSIAVSGKADIGPAAP